MKNAADLDLVLTILQYSNGATGEYALMSVKADVRALFYSRDVLCTERSDSYSTSNEMLDDIAKKIYSWFHNGWR